MFEVSVAAMFSASHQLRQPDGSYERRHAHDWHVVVTYAGERLNEMGVLVDFGVIRAQLHGVIATLRDQNLNELPMFADRAPSAENVAAYVAEALDAAGVGAELRCVQVEEEHGCVACFYPPRQEAR